MIYSKLLYLQRKEAQGEDDSLPKEITDRLADITKEELEPLTVFKVGVYINFGHLTLPRVNFVESKLRES